MGYNVRGGKLDRDLSGVDSVAILKDCEHTNSEYLSKRPSSAGPSNGAVSFFPFHHHCASLTCSPRTKKAPSIFPRIRRHNGFGHYPSRLALLVLRRRRRYDGCQRCAHLGRRDIPNYFRKVPFYVDLVDLMHKVRTITSLQSESP